MKKMLQKEIKISNEFSKIRYVCKCGHPVYMSNKMDFTYCSYCGKRVYKDDFTEFKRKLLRACGRDNNEQVSQQKSRN